MEVSQAIHPFVRSLVAHLWDEERLIQVVIEATDSLVDAMRNGDANTFREAQNIQAKLSVQLATASAECAQALSTIAARLGITEGKLTLRELGEKLSPADSYELCLVQARLSIAAQTLKRVQSQAANLLMHLRSYFRNVFSTLAMSDTTERYGRSGSLLGAGAGSAIQACG